MKEYKYFTLITGFFVAVLIISNIASSKILVLGPFTFDGGTILFPISYIFGDILTEVYGYRKSRQVIWIGFAATLLMAAVLSVVGFLPSAPGWENQDAYLKILGTTPRIVAASLAAYFAGEFSNSYLLARMKILTRGRWLFTRTIGSTIVGEGVDTVFFTCIAFAGTVPGNTLVAILVSNYLFKVGFEIVATPLTYALVGFLKKHEQVDVYDRGTNFNPFVDLWKAHPGLDSNSRSH
ncbi:MAG: queuosine precursor transporter [Dehalococcoidales bacterium]|nr:queuosine precursor transporter [Dehalococcoidales bacterium]